MFLCTFAKYSHYQTTCAIIIILAGAERVNYLAHGDHCGDLSPPKQSMQVL